MIDHFKVIAPFYEKVFPMKYAEEIVKRAGLPVDGLLLDAGGGTGRVSKAVSNRVSKVVLLDVSLDMLSQGKNDHNLLPVNSTTETIPFDSNQFQVILLIDAFHHVLSQEKTLCELWRVLQPGGRLIIIEPDINLFAVKLVALFEKVMLMRSHFRKPEEIQKMAQNLSGSEVTLVREQFNAWVIVEKLEI
jgi:demethylmenaquinone methyltransferase/2-methoxy-6-polyprenyl-1,4-benzoquinol methylase